LAAVRAKVVRASETAEVTEAVVGVVAVSGVVVISAVQVPGRVKAHRLVGSAQEVAQVAVLAETVGAVDSADRVEGILAPAVVSVVDGPAVGWGLRVALCVVVGDRLAGASVVDLVGRQEAGLPVVSPLVADLAAQVPAEGGPAVGWDRLAGLSQEVADQAAVVLVADRWEADHPVVSPLVVALAGLLEEVRGNDQGVRLATNRAPGG